jgi:hypothetical protein
MSSALPPVDLLGIVAVGIALCLAGSRLPRHTFLIPAALAALNAWLAYAVQHDQAIHEAQISALVLALDLAPHSIQATPPASWLSAILPQTASPLVDLALIPLLAIAAIVLVAQARPLAFLRRARIFATICLAAGIGLLSLSAAGYTQGVIAIANTFHSIDALLASTAVEITLLRRTVGLTVGASLTRTVTAPICVRLTSALPKGYVATVDNMSMSAPMTPLAASALCDADLTVLTVAHVAP